MTIFPCRRCGEVPEVEDRGTDRMGFVTLGIIHRCRKGPQYKVQFTGLDADSCRADCIYRWNEQNASDNPKWWPERYDYLKGTIKPRGDENK